MADWGRLYVATVVSDGPTSPHVIADIMKVLSRRGRLATLTSFHSVSRVFRLVVDGCCVFQSHPA